MLSISGVVSSSDLDGESATATAAVASADFTAAEEVAYRFGDEAECEGAGFVTAVAVASSLTTTASSSEMGTSVPLLEEDGVDIFVDDDGDAESDAT